MGRICEKGNNKSGVDLISHVKDQNVYTVYGEENDEFIKVICNATLTNEVSDIFQIACNRDINEVNRLLKLIPQDFYASMLSRFHFHSFCGLDDDVPLSAREQCTIG